MYHFVRDDVVFDEGKDSGTFKTNRTYKDENGVTTNATVLIKNEPHVLTLTDIAGQNVTVQHSKANLLVRKGVCHKIDTVLKYYE